MARQLVSQFLLKSSVLCDARICSNILIKIIRRASSSTELLALDQRAQRTALVQCSADASSQRWCVPHWMRGTSSIDHGESQGVCAATLKKASRPAPPDISESSHQASVVSSASPHQQWMCVESRDPHPRDEEAAMSQEITFQCVQQRWRLERLVTVWAIQRKRRLEFDAKESSATVFTIHSQVDERRNDILGWPDGLLRNKQNKTTNKPCRIDLMGHTTTRSINGSSEWRSNFK